MIRRVTESELPLCLRVIHEAFGTVAEEFGLTPDNCPTNGAFMPLTRLLEDYQKGDAMFVCREGGAIAGFMQLSRRGQAVYELEKLAVLPEYRHRGYGKALLGFAKQEAAANGAARIREAETMVSSQRLRPYGYPGVFPSAVHGGLPGDGVRRLTPTGRGLEPPFALPRVCFSRSLCRNG